MMVPILLLLLICCSGALSQFTLTQPASVSASPASTVQISCTISSGFSFGFIHWYQHKEGESPKFLLRRNINDDKTDFGPEFSSRFSPSNDAPKKVAFVTITKVQAGDEAVYYCAAFHTASKSFVFGSGTTLTVTGQPTAPPTVNVFPPSPEELKTSDKATAVCLIDGFYPSTIQVTWQADGTAISSGVETTTPTKLNDKYAASSYLNMKKSEWESYERVTCKVMHEGKPFEKEVRRSECA
nr:immunoglobulin lambda-1 light chain-like isoform X1 [Zootoca vivipara]